LSLDAELGCNFPIHFLKNIKIKVYVLAPRLASPRLASVYPFSLKNPDARRIPRVNIIKLPLYKVLEVAPHRRSTMRSAFCNIRETDKSLGRGRKKSSKYIRWYIA
jgi:hypothetical protein